MGTRRLGLGFPSINSIMYLQADEISTNPAGNTSVVRFYLECADGNGWGPMYFSVTDANNWTQQFGPVNLAGVSTQGPWDVTVAHYSDGSLTAPISMWTTNYAAQYGSGRINGYLPLTTLARAPGTPTNSGLTRNSDAQLTASWTRQDPNNSAATSTQVQASINGAAATLVASIGAASSVAFATMPNRKTQSQVRMGNAAGWSGWSAWSAAVFTTPAAPSNVEATRDGLDILVTLKDNCAYTERQFPLQHGTVDGAGVITWDPSNLTTIPGGAAAGGTFTYRHVAPAQGVTHVYRVAAQTTASPQLTSVWVQSNTAIPPTPPNAPNFLQLPQFADRAKPFQTDWLHNPVDSSPQSAYQIRYSTNGGSSWTTSAKTAATASTHTFPANLWAANTTVTFQVMTWGIATVGGQSSGGSPWSPLGTVTFKSAPTATIIRPANGATLGWSTIDLAVGFTQPEGAQPVRAQYTLTRGGETLEQSWTTTLPSTILDTLGISDETYTLKVFVEDSNGLTSPEVSTTFQVHYLAPPVAVVTVDYIPEPGSAHLIVNVPAADNVVTIPAVALSIERLIDGGPADLLIDKTPLTGGEMSFSDPIPTIHGVNLYRVTTWGGDDTATLVTVTLVTAEDRLVFFNAGDAFDQPVSGWGNLELGSQPGRDQALVDIEDADIPVSMFGAGRNLAIPGRFTVVADTHADVFKIERFLQTATLICYREPTGRRIYGQIKGGFSGWKAGLAEFTYTVTESD